MKTNRHLQCHNYELVLIVSVISMFGFLNRWNDTLGTKLEDVPKDFVEEKLKPLGWA